MNVSANASYLNSYLIGMGWKCTSIGQDLRGDLEPGSVGE